MRLVHTIAVLRKELAAFPAVQTRGFVPTMGALHAGHGRLIHRARAECDQVMVSVFVNPLQFGPKEDYTGYPRTLQEDCAFCDARGVDILFAPEAEEIYPRPQLTFVEVSRMSEPLCGRFRPNHFRGVTTVVLKLFHMIQPHRAYFGEKDAQQLALIRRMVLDLNLPTTIVAVPTVREDDGLACSSRNRYLNPQQRQAAVVLYRALQAAQNQIAAGATDPRQVQAAALAILQQEPLARVEYLELVDPDEMQAVTQITGPARLAGAIWIGSTRLIDNVLCQPPG
ncbi:MAG: pantoate--beta-alanine ligase [Acidobacteria bacterium]|nr:pantoate--beta-alanine ligase [Acidobacteriota bacterium]